MKKSFRRTGSKLNTRASINIGTDPVTLEGRLMAIMLRAFAVAVFGYVATWFASCLVGRRVERAGRRDEIAAIERLTQGVERLNTTLDRLQNMLQPTDRSGEEGT